MLHTLTARAEMVLSWRDLDRSRPERGEHRRAGSCGCWNTNRFTPILIRYRWRFGSDWWKQTTLFGFRRRKDKIHFFLPYLSLYIARTTSISSYKYQHILDSLTCSIQRDIALLSTSFATSRQTPTRTLNNALR